MDKLIIGRYIVGNSFIHRLDPRSKLLAMLVYIVIIFWANNPLTYVIITLFTLFLVILSKIKLGFFLDGIKPMIWIILFSTLFQVFFNTKGNVLWSIGFLKITEVGLNQGWMIFLRFILIISFSTLLTLTTTPLSLSDAVESLLKPMTVFKVPAHEIGDCYGSTRLSRWRRPNKISSTFMEWPRYFIHCCYFSFGGNTFLS